MKAIAIKAKGPVSVLEIMSVPKPIPGSRDVIVQVKAVSMNPADSKVRGRSGPLTPLPEPRILGWDAAGIVTEVGSEAKLYKVGDEVYFAGAVNRPGCNAEFVAVDERIIALKPKSLSFEEAAAVPLTVLTAWEAMAEGMAIPIVTDKSNEPKEKKTILIFGGAGGVGSIAIQLAKKLHHLHVIATASRPESIEYCKKMGADHVIDHKNIKESLEKIGLKGVDYCFETASSENLGAIVEIMNPLGKIVIINETGGKPLEFQGGQGKRLTLIWELMFTRPMYNVMPELQGEILAKTAKLIDEGVLHHRMTKCLNFWTQLAEAHTEIEQGHTIGKISLKL